jgi:hypothetical protein
MTGDSVGLLIFFLSVSITGLSLSVFRFTKYESFNYAAFLIHLLVFSLSLFLLSIALTYTRFYIIFPQFWRIFTAMAYLNAPLCFLFIRVILTKRQAFRRTDLWVVVPPLIHLINMLPFILSDKAQKLEAVRAVMIDGNAFILELEGFLLPGLNSWLRAFVGLSMMIGQLLMLSGAVHHFTQGEGSMEKTDRRLFYWLWALTASVAVTILLILFQFAFTLFPGWNMMQIIMAATSVSLIFIMISLPLVPGLNKGFKHPLAKSDLFF